MSDSALPWRSEACGLVLSVRLTPRSDRDAIDGIAHLADGKTVLKTRVRALPIAGEANAALVRLIAGTLGVPVRDVRVAEGSARLKRVKVAGEAAALAAALERICVRPTIRAAAEERT
ncbi:MAG TPA: DUF167 family protein [Steroidobacteraceae bacterium]|nr:DUF167 family protein [Steroidobacteraceae bacterium]